MTALLASGLLAIAWVAALLLEAIGCPDMIAFLAVGLVLGPFGVGAVHITLSDPVVRTTIGVAAALILYDGGHGIDLAHLRRGWLGLSLLATLGVVVTAALTALAAHRLLGWPWETAALFGAIVASTDPAAVIPVMRHAGVAAHISHIAQAESALNDVTGSLLTFAVVAAVGGHAAGVGALVTTLGSTAALGALVGVAVAWTTAWAVRWLVPRLMPLRAYDFQVSHLVTVVLSYAGAAALGGNGLMAAFAAGVTHNLRLPERSEPIASHLSTVGFLARVVVFLILGVTLDPSGAVRPAAAVIALAALFMLVIRPVAVAVSLLPDRKGRWQARDALMLSWVRETGVIPVALAAYVASLGIPGAAEIEAKLAALVFATLVVQGLTTGAVARRLNLSAGRGAVAGSAAGR